MNLYPPDELLSSQQVSDELQGMISARTVTNWCKAGKLKATRAGGKWLIRRADLQAFLQQGGREESRGKAEPLAA
jgi:excisionase family DNA binding protein